jgi:hypothetical protein
MDEHQNLIVTALTGTSVSFDREHLPERFKLLNWGENETPDGPLVVNERTAAALSRQIAQDTFRRIVLDFEHQSFPGHPNYKPAPRHNAAHGDLELVEGDGVYITGLSWTPKGIEHGADYCDLSPVAVHTKRAQKGDAAVVLGILSAALCDNGAVQGITAFSASYQPPEKDMTDEQKAKFDEILGTIKTQGEQLTALQARLDALQPKLDADPEVTAASFDQVKGLAEAAVKPEALEESRQQVSALSARIDALQKAQMIQIAVLQGKAVTLDETAVSAMSADSLAQHIAGLGVTLPVVRLTPVGDGGEGVQTTSLSAQIDALIADIRRETGVQDFRQLWALASARKPELFKK